MTRARVRALLAEAARSRASYEAAGLPAPAALRLREGQLFAALDRAEARAERCPGVRRAARAGLR